MCFSIPYLFGVTMLKLTAVASPITIVPPKTVTINSINNSNSSNFLFLTSIDSFIIFIQWIYPRFFSALVFRFSSVQTLYKFCFSVFSPFFRCFFFVAYFSMQSIRTTYCNIILIAKTFFFLSFWFQKNKQTKQNSHMAPFWIKIKQTKTNNPPRNKSKISHTHKIGFVKYMKF